MTKRPPRVETTHTPEGCLHQQLDDSSPTKRKQQDQHQEMSSTGRYHIYIYSISPRLFTAAVELADDNENQGLKMNKSKTKVIMENDTKIYVNNIQIENFDS